MQCNTSKSHRCIKIKRQSFVEIKSSLSVFTRKVRAEIYSNKNPQLWRSSRRMKFHARVFQLRCSDICQISSSRTQHTPPYKPLLTLSTTQNPIFNLLWRHASPQCIPLSRSAGNFTHNASHHAIKDNNGAREPVCS